VHQFVYPAALTADEDAGGFVVRFPDVPEAITQGNNLQDALHQAADCLEEAIAGRIRRGEPVPQPSDAPAQHHIPVPVRTAAKAALYVALQQAELTEAGLARRLGWTESDVRRLIDPRYASNLAKLDCALSALGQHLILGFEGEKARPVRRAERA